MILLIIFRLRCASGISIATILKRRYKDNGSLSAFRKFQRLDYKLRKAKLDLKFLEECKRSSVIPTFLIPTSRFQRLLSIIQKKLLNEEITIKQSKIRVLSNELNESLTHLSSHVSSIDCLHLCSVCDLENGSKLKHHETIQEKKLLRLRLDVSKFSTLDPHKVIFNYSSRQLTDTEKILLARGLNFSVPPRKLRFCDFLIPFEKLFRLIRNEDISPKSRMDTDFIKTRMKDIALTGFKSYTPPKSIFSDDEHAQGN